MSDNEDCVIVEENVNFKSISCENIPELFLDKLTAKKHFSKFGKIKSLVLRPSRFSCTVEYETVEDAEYAFRNAGNFNNQAFSIKYTPNEVSHARNTEEWVDPEVQAELEAMGSNRYPPVRTQSMKYLVPKMPKPILKSKPTPTESIPRFDVGPKNELEAILRKQAVDIDDKHQILDARDKLIRLKTVRTTDIKKAVSTKGTCPDMCPEKERLLREAKHQVATFELEEGNRNIMNHKIAIKEYSRSSADQETPLAHELRPEPVLKMTMSYLLHRLMDLCEDPEINLGDWFHFVWDRTRSIRKDITQQELCSLGGVELVEQCARFHIHCAARLVAEDPSVFDQRINTENLTKCLQTLKYMYHDLRLKNVKCPNEAEFRAYVILLNLNDSNFLWEIKQLPTETQNSPELRSALNIYFAMDSNNYVKFFKLVRETTYMNACILLRYFTQIRIKALRTIIKAYNSPRQSVSVLLKYLAQILAFESEEAAGAFFEYHGLVSDSKKVCLDRSLFYIPDIPFIMDRALTIIEAKRQVSVGETISGHKLDSVDIFEKHIPHDSFDENGYLRPEAWTAEDQENGIGTRKVKDSGVFKIPLASPPITPKQQQIKPIFGTRNNQEPTKTPMFSLNSSGFNTKTIPLFTQPENTNTGNIFGAFEFSKQEPSKTENIFTNSTFSKPVSTENKDNSIFSISFGGNKDEDKVDKPSASIFGGTTATTNIFGANSFDSVIKNDNIFKHFVVPKPKSDESNQNSIFNRIEQSSILKDWYDKVEDEGVSNKQVENLQDEKQRKIDEVKREKQRIAEEKQKIKEIEKQEKLKIKEIEKLEKQKLKEIEKQEKQKLKEIEKGKKEKLKQIHKTAETLLKQLLNEVQKECAVEISKEIVSVYEKLLKDSNTLCLEILDEYIQENLMEIIKNELMVQQNHNILEKYFQLWKENVQRTKNHRKLIEATPIWLPDECLNDQAVNIAHPLQNETLELMRRYRLGVPNEIDLKQFENKQIDIFKLCSNEFQQQQLSRNIDEKFLRCRKYMKLLISIPNEQEEYFGFNAFINNWLEKIIIRNKKSDEFLCESKENISICIRKIEGIKPINEAKKKVTIECDHTNGILFVMTLKNLLNSKKRLHHLLKLFKIYEKIPIGIIVYNYDYNSSNIIDYIENELELKQLRNNEKISNYNILINHKFDKNLHKIFEKNFQFLVKSMNFKQTLEMQQLIEFLQITLGEEFWRRLNDSWLINPSFRKICTQPNHIIQLYNEGIDKLINIIKHDYDDYQEFPIELQKFVPKLNSQIPLELEYFPTDWKASQRNQKIEKFLQECKLKPWKNNSMEIEILEKYLLEYSQNCIENVNSSKKAGYNAIKCLLENLSKQDLINFEISKRFNYISWLEIIKSISIELLQFKWNLLCKNLPQEIIYKKSLFYDYINNPWWFNSEDIKSIKMEEFNEENDMENHDKKRRKLDLDNLDVEAIMTKAYGLIEKVEKNANKLKRKRYSTGNTSQWLQEIKNSSF